MTPLAKQGKDIYEADAAAAGGRAAEKGIRDTNTQNVEEASRCELRFLS